MSDQNPAKIVFSLGTVAELIKVAPVMIELDTRSIAFSVVGTGQHHLPESELFNVLRLSNRFSSLGSPPDSKGSLAFGLWCLKTLKTCRKYFRDFIDPDVRVRPIVVVHGDTVSTIIGAYSAKKAGFTVAHIEAGLRSGNYFKPFPEELDRVLTSKFSDIHFCPYESAVKNLKSARGTKVNTFANSNLDALRWAISLPPSRKFQNLSSPYFILILHRQENLMNDELVRRIIRSALTAAKQMRCLFVAHPNTLEALTRLGLRESVARCSNLTLIERQAYLDFIFLLRGASMIWTDGGGNQQECAYLGLPTLILRDRTESEEGVGSNVVIAGNGEQVIDQFFTSHESYRGPERFPEVYPSKIISDTLQEFVEDRG
jgi:UDP-N-acetylglucosamine 2-epimerase (non-hydrolysing)